MSVPDDRSDRPVFPVAARGSTSGRPINVLLDVLGERWTLRILWELRDGAHTFRALRDRCAGVSPTLLNTRLRRLRELHLVEHEAGRGYALTARGAELGTLLLPLSKWADAWARSVAGTQAEGGR